MPKCLAMDYDFSTNLLARLQCPKCHSPVARDGSGVACTNADCGLHYPIDDGVPVMLVEVAERPTPCAPGDPPV